MRQRKSELTELYFVGKELYFVGKERLISSVTESLAPSYLT